MNKKGFFIALIAVSVGVILLAGRQGPSSNEAIAKSEPVETAATKVDSAENSTPIVKLKPKLDHDALSDAPLDSDYVMGSDDAPITLIEYASLSCPHCAKFHTKTLPKLKKEYIETGKLRYILRQFPLNESAMAGAMLVHCVGEKIGADRYYQFNDVLFSAQNKWAFDANFRESLKVFAEVGGVSAAQFDSCLNDGAREKRILVSRKEGTGELKVTGTPFIFLNGHPHGGNKSFKAVKKEIDYLLRNGG